MESLNSILDLYTEQNDELEIRLGFYTQRGFTAGITQFAYHYFLKSFSNEFPTLEKTTNVCILKRYPNGLRNIDHEGGSSSVSKKERSGVLDLRSESLRVAISREYHDIEDLPIDPDSYTMKFKRIRTTFIDQEGGYRIDISHNMPFGQSRKNASPYELEIEFTDKPTIEKLRRLIGWTSQIYSHMKKYYQSVIYRFNVFFKNEVRVKHELYLGVSKPINIKTGNIPYLANYVFSPKPNGVSYFLFFDRFGTYHLNETEVIYVHKPIADLYGTIILGEYMPNGFGNGVFHGKDIYLGYDTLFFKGKDIRGLSAIDRNRKLSVVTNHIPNFTVLPMFFSGESPTQALHDTFKFIHLNFKPEENDGMIMKHNYSHYNFKYDQGGYKYPVWKWKPPEHITIDFSVSCDPSYMDKDACGRYQIFTGIPEGETKQFMGTSSYPYDGYVNIPEENFGLIHAGTIIEFGWDYKDKKLYPTRIRDDKVKPNFYVTAESTWEDIFHPISEKELIELSTYSINRKKDNQYIASMLCKFVRKTGDAGVLSKLDKYLNSNILSDAFLVGFEIAIQLGVNNPVVNAIKNSA